MSLRVPSPRIEGDAYYTPDDVAQKCVNAIRRRIPKLCRIIEPSVGGGAFLRALGNIGVSRLDTYAIDIDPDAAGLTLAGGSTVGDFADRGTTSAYPGWPNWVIGNPPYRNAQEHVERAIEIATADRGRPGGVAFLLRLAFLEGQGRAEFWRKHPPTEVHILTRRPSFTGGKTDSCAYAFFVWCAGEREPLRWIP